jgi:chromosome segregation ATPase
MRDYNQIQFRSPNKAQQRETAAVKRNVKNHPLAVSPEEEKKESESTRTPTATKTTPTKERPSQIQPPNNSRAVTVTPPSASRTLKAPASHTGSASTAATSATSTLLARQQHHQQRALSPTMSSQQRSPSPAHSKQSIESTLSAADALALRRDGAEATVGRLRQALDQSSSKDSSAKSSLAKSDAVILELRSSVRQLKRQLEKVQVEKALVEEKRKATTQQLRDLQQQNPNSNNGNGNNGNGSHNNEQMMASDSRIGELQVQLDRAHAQMLTADMVRKELEDTLEAEQYTWELRVQDQERTIDQLQRECAVLVDDLEECRSQWKEAEDGWTKEVQELQSQLEAAQQDVKIWKAAKAEKGKDVKDDHVLKGKLQVLEQERNELQSCLDEALKELEAVDAELQGENEGQLQAENARLQRTLVERDTLILEPLQHLYRWVLERDGEEENKNVHTSPRDARELLAAIQSHLQRMPANDKDLSATRAQVAELESQLSVYRGDLHAREESSADLRASLKEAVALLKPLQDAASKAEREKVALRRQIEDLQKEDSVAGELQRELQQAKRALQAKDDELEHLRHDIESLELQLSRAKVMAASNVIAASPIATPETPVLSKAREELRAKRAAEKTLKQLLKDAQNRFNTLHKQNAEVESMNNELQDRLHQAEEDLELKPSESDEPESMQRVQALESKLLVQQGELAKKEVELRNIQRELEHSRSALRPFDDDGEDKLFHTQTRVKELELKLSQTTTDLKAKRESEKKLNKSLREALGLLKPLQMHLEEAEDEKNELRDELLAVRTRQGEGQSVRSRDIPSEQNGETIAHLEDTVRQLEQENSQLHDALEDMSQSLNVSHLSGKSQKSESRLKEEIVEVKSRYDVTKSRLEDAYVENHTLVEALNKREQEESDMMQEIQILRGELANAKFVATSALVKVEELTMANVEQLSLNHGDGHDVDRDLLFKEKSREFDREMRSARQNGGRREKVPYRLT